MFKGNIQHPLDHHINRQFAKERKVVGERNRTLLIVDLSCNRLLSCGNIELLLLKSCVHICFFMYQNHLQGSSEAYQPPSDIWSCGILLHLMLTGEPPFVADSPEEVYKMIMETGSLTPDYEDMSEE